MLRIHWLLAVLSISSGTLAQSLPKDLAEGCQQLAVVYGSEHSELTQVTPDKVACSCSLTDGQQQQQTPSYGIRVWLHLNQTADCESIFTPGGDGPSPGRIYQGQFVGGKQQGKGNLTWLAGPKQGEFYDGDFWNDTRNGTGTYVWYSSYDIYDGGWLNDRRHGRGRLRYGSGDANQQRLEYDGEWRDDVIQGRGRMTYKNGDVYEGEFADDHRNGQGMMTYANGDRFNGTWLVDEKHGLADFFNSSWPNNGGDGVEQEWIKGVHVA